MCPMVRTRVTRSAGIASGGRMSYELGYAPEPFDSAQDDREHRSGRRARDADRTPRRQPALRFLSRRTLLHNLRLPPGMGVRGPAAGRTAVGRGLAALRALALLATRDPRALCGRV